MNLSQIIKTDLRRFSALLPLALLLLITNTAFADVDLEEINKRIRTAAEIKEQFQNQEADFRRIRKLLDESRQNLSEELDELYGEKEFEKQQEVAKKALDKAKKESPKIFKPTKNPLTFLLNATKALKANFGAGRETRKLMDLATKRAQAHGSKAAGDLETAIERREAQIKAYDERLKENLEYQKSIDQVVDDAWKDILLDLLDELKRHEAEAERVSAVRKKETEARIPEFKEELAAAARKAQELQRQRARAAAINRMRNQIAGGGGSLVISGGPGGVTYQIGGDTFGTSAPDTKCFLLALCLEFGGQ